MENDMILNLDFNIGNDEVLPCKILIFKDYYLNFNEKIVELDGKTLSTIPFMYKKHKVELETHPENEVYSSKCILIQDTIIYLDELKDIRMGKIDKESNIYDDHYVAINTNHGKVHEATK